MKRLVTVVWATPETGKLTSSQWLSLSLQNWLTPHARKLSAAFPLQSARNHRFTQH